MTTSTSSSPEGKFLTNLIEVKPGLKFSQKALKALLPDVETVLFFGKVYELDAQQLGNLLLQVHRTPLTEALFGGDGEHSHDLQDYIVDLCDHDPSLNAGRVKFSHEVQPKGEILPEVWKQLEIVVATSIKDVAKKLADTVGLLPGKKGNMIFRSMMVMNAKRPTFGDHKAHIHHAPQAQNLLIFDVSGSMSEPTVRAIVEDVVALSYAANAHLAIVSNTCTYWQPGEYSVEAVLEAAEYGGTQYEQLTPLFDRDWGTVITIADYDSSRDARSAIAACTGSIEEVLDVSLVKRPTFLAECVGQLAKTTRPILLASDDTYGVLR